MTILCPLAGLAVYLPEHTGRVLALGEAPLQSASIIQDFPFTFLIKIKLIIILLYLTGML